MVPVGLKDCQSGTLDRVIKSVLNTFKIEFCKINTEMAVLPFSPELQSQD